MILCFLEPYNPGKSGAMSAAHRKRKCSSSYQREKRNNKCIIKQKVRKMMLNLHFAAGESRMTQMVNGLERVS